MHAGLAEGEDDGEELLRRLVELAVGFQVEVDVDEVRAGEELGVMLEVFGREGEDGYGEWGINSGEIERK